MNEKDETKTANNPTWKHFAHVIKKAGIMLTLR